MKLINQEYRISDVNINYIINHSKKKTKKSNLIVLIFQLFRQGNLNGKNTSIVRRPRSTNRPRDLF